MYQIAFDAKRAFLNFSGLGNYSRLLLKSLSELYPSNLYHLYTPSFADNPRLSFADAPNICLHVSDHSTLLGAALWRSRGMAKDVNKGTASLFHGLSGELPIGLKKPAVVTIHDLIFMRYPQFYKVPDRLIYRAKHSMACHRANKIIAISRQTADDLVNMLGVKADKIEIIYQSCDPAFYKTPTQPFPNWTELYGIPPEPFILNIGTMESRKNLVSVLKALALLPSEIHLVAVGRSTPYVTIIKDCAKSLGLESRVHLIHNLPFSQFPALYRSARVMVYPSLFEGFGLPVLEAQAAGLPVVTSNISSLPEAGGNAALYTDPFDHQAIAQCISSLLEDSPFRRQSILSGLTHANQLSPSNSAASVLELYRQLKF